MSVETLNMIAVVIEFEVVAGRVPLRRSSPGRRPHSVTAVSCCVGGDVLAN